MNAYENLTSAKAKRGLKPRLRWRRRETLANRRAAHYISDESNSCVVGSFHPMSDLAATDELFFNRAGLGRAQVEAVVDDALGGADDGELFLEYRQSENVTIDDGKIKSAAFDTAQGFGLRAVAGESTGYAHASELSEAALKRACSGGCSCLSLPAMLATLTIRGSSPACSRGSSRFVSATVPL